MNATDFINQLRQVQLDAPFTSRGDVKALHRMWTVVSTTMTPVMALYTLLLAWAIREPRLVEAFHIAAESTSGSSIQKAKQIFMCLETVLHMNVSYEFLPKRLVQYLKPSVLLKKWNYRHVYAIAKELHRAFVHSPIVADKKKVLQLLSDLPGVGAYSKEHFWRIACYVAKKTDPGSEFVVMGDGASKRKYATLRAIGLNCMDDVNQHLDEPIGPGMLAYYLCMGNLLE